MGLNKRIKSFGYAFNGLFHLIKNETNAQIHIVAAVIAISMGVFFSVSVTEWCFIILSIGIVIAAEAFNTVIERLVDHMFPDYHNTAKVAKDIAAGGVLISAIAAFVVGIVIFLPKIIALI
jgi:diacylglycerol kinase (ATP)